MTAYRASRLGMEQSLGGVLLGTSGPDRIEATAEDQALRGLGGADVLISRFNGSSLLGGAGADILRTEVSISAPDEGAVSLNAFQHGGAGDDRLTVDIAAAAEFGSATMALWVDGDRGDDVIDVAATLTGGLSDVAFDARIMGGAGDDRIAVTLMVEPYSRLEDPLRIRGGTGDDVIEAHMENLDRGRSDAGAAELRILGEDGDDQISAFVRVGSNGGVRPTNRVDGGAGDDVIDARTYAGSNNSNSYQINEVFGRDGDDILRASHECRSVAAHLTNLLDGGAGNDELYVTQDTRESRDDVESLSLDNDLIGGLGADVLRVDLILDLRAFQVDNRLDGGGGADVLTVVIDRPDGASSSRVVHSLLSGGAGADRLGIVGGIDSVLEGGRGRDTFVLDPSVTQAQTIALTDFNGSADRLEFAGLTDRGAPGLADDLDAIAVFSTGSDGVLEVQLGRLTLRLPTAPAGADSFADLVDDPATQLIAGDLLLA